MKNRLILILICYRRCTFRYRQWSWFNSTCCTNATFHHDLQHICTHANFQWNKCQKDTWWKRCILRSFHQPNFLFYCYRYITDSGEDPTLILLCYLLASILCIYPFFASSYVFKLRNSMKTELLIISLLIPSVMY